MKHIKQATIILGFILFSCNQTDNKATTVTEEKKAIPENDKEQFHNLIRQVFDWVDSKESFSVFPVKTDSYDSIIIGVDLELHKQDLSKLRQTNLFATEFIDNYNNIVLALDEGLKNGKYGQWLVGEYPTFPFANGHVPWCLCQCNCSEESIYIEIIKIDNKVGVLKLKRGENSSWVDFEIRVTKENNKWKIAYLEGFDFEKSTRIDG